METIYDKKCKMVVKMVKAVWLGGREPNNFEPIKESTKTIGENGIVCINDILYGNKYPNSFIDIYYPDDSGKKRPVYVYIHGGGFIFGNKSMGDPLASGNVGTKLTEIVKAGYILVSMDYALAPEYRFPVPLIQMDELFEFMLAHQDEYHFDMQHLCVGGGSAGSDMTEIYATAVCNPEYAQQVGINPPITTDNLKVLCLDESALDSRTFNNDMYTMLLCFLGENDKEYKGKHLILNAKENIKDTYIPSWINTSNKEIYFEVEAEELAKKLEKIGVKYDLVHFPKERGLLGHGYMDDMVKNPLAKEAFDRMMKFVGENI